MSAPNFTPTSENNRTKTRADAARESWQAAQARTPARRWWDRAHLGPRLALALVSAALGGLMVGSLAYLTMPIQADRLDRVFADVNGDGAADFIVSGWVVFADPKAPAP